MPVNYNCILAAFTWLAITIFYCYQYILRIIPNIIMPELLSKFSIKASDFGTFASIYYIGYIIVHIPLGILISRVGGKYVLSICIILATIGLIPIIYFNNWSLVLLGRLLIGIGSSAAIIGALQTFRQLFANNFSQMLGLTVATSLITAIFSNNLLIIMITDIGLEKVINMLIILGFMLSCITYFLLPVDKGFKQEDNIIQELINIIKNYKLLTTSFLAGLMVGPLEGFADAWGSAFLYNCYGIERTVAGNIISLILVGMCAGCLVLPYTADKTSSHNLVTLISGIIMALCFFGLIFLKDMNLTLLKLICFLVGFFSAYQVVIITKISNYVPAKMSGLAAAVANMIIMAFGSLFHKLIGFTVEMLWDGKMIENMPAYSNTSYTYGISIILVAIIISIMGFTIIIFKEKN